MMAHLVIVTKHHEALLREGVGEPLVPAQMLPEPVAEEDGRPHPPVPHGPPVAGEQLVTPGSVIMTGKHHHHHYTSSSPVEWLRPYGKFYKLCTAY